MTDEKKLADLKNKVADHKRFAFILLALSGFLSIGLVIPNDAIADGQHGKMVGLIVALLISAFFFHKSAMKTQRIVNEEE
ncbi:YrhC-like protein [Evansella caseinilytica]|uniref:YrhC-like protein n=1 Tax=Evansella caseinilytica TaxID=1503961 RepID=A0A1H3KB50_9BACI|nr:YrhC family protein [Evansella caseinilytica]SDY49447.1 YrhC-like protein [Evansella caseinilytica]